MLIVDSFNGGIAVLEYSYDEAISTFELPREILPVEVREGDVVKFEIDDEATLNRRRRIEKLSIELFE